MTTTPTPHKHAALIREIAEHVASGAFNAGHYELHTAHRDLIGWQSGQATSWLLIEPSINIDARFVYRIVKTDKHPDNIKPKKKLIDWEKMPKGTMTNFGELRGFAHGAALIEDFRKLPSEFTRSSVPIELLQLAEQTEFTYWGGGECPVPKGVDVECALRGKSTFRATMHSDKFRWVHLDVDSDIIAYRITGLAEGWTDNPGEAA
jgi:hypothetical protein